MEIDTYSIIIRKSIKYIELATAIVALFHYYKYKGTFITYFVTLLCVTVVIEFTGLYMKVMGYTSNFILYNIYHLINFTVLLLLFKNCIKNTSYQKIVIGLLVIFLIIYSINMLVENYFNQLITFPFICGSTFVIMAIILYYLELLSTNKVLYVKRNLVFWVSVGLLLYFAGKIPMRIVRNYWFEIVDYQIIFFTESLLSIIMNLFFLIAFIWSEKRYLY
ncbi:hypothetical protein [Neptunitalea lumnitzerae]|uniref:hypothetical protein n=1 Tax=Neptunitalea lumnitzerae TaxID=2965509 RepID=UPI002490DC63|nr:hypothetical protein [Neptunitalea sp. Y10]